jgi:hypothetical protein
LKEHVYGDQVLLLLLLMVVALLQMQGVASHPCIRICVLSECWLGGLPLANASRASATCSSTQWGGAAFHIVAAANPDSGL